MAYSSKSKALAALAALTLLGACADFMNNWDTVSFRGGDAASANTAIHQISPYPPNVENTNVQSGG